nr:MAG TPA: hypothetical protein [Caudoviricetes sp.]
MENNIEMIENILNTERRNRRGNREIRFEVNSNCYKAVSKFLSDYKRVLKENEELKNQKATARKINELLVQRYSNSISVQKIKEIIDRIDYDIKKTKELISNNSNIYTSDRKNDYQIVRLRAMNTKSLDIKNRLQKLLESEE